MKNILVAIDFSDVTSRLLEHAASLAAKYGAKAWIIHVAAPDPDFVGFEAGPQVVRDSRAETLRSEHRDLQRYAREFKEKGIEAEALLVQGPATSTLLEEADRLDADLIVLGSHGHGIIYDALVGSVCKGVLKKSKRPLLLVPFDV
jgi:nucleotide-binding universal stress UspA family protein